MADDMHYIENSETIVLKGLTACGLKLEPGMRASNVKGMTTCEECKAVLSNIKIVMEEVPKDMQSCLCLIGDYALDMWLMQIRDGTAAHAKLSPNHAMILLRLIELAEESLKEES